MAEQQDNSADDQQSAGGAEQPAEAGAGAEKPVISSEPTASKKSGGQGTRIVVWAAVAIFAVVAIMEIRAKTDAEQTGNAWRDQFSNADPREGDLLESDLDASIKGAPEVDEVELSALSPDDTRYPPRTDVARVTKIVRTYSWKGLVQDYHVHVYLGLGKDRSIEDVVGPQGAFREFKYIDKKGRRAEEGNEQIEEGSQESGDVQKEAAGSGSTDGNAE